MKVCLTQIEKTGQLVFLSRFHCTLTMEMFLRSPPSEGGFILLVQNESYHSSAILHRWTFATFVLKKPSPLSSLSPNKGNPFARDLNFYQARENLCHCPFFILNKGKTNVLVLAFFKQGKPYGLVLSLFQARILNCQPFLPT